MTNRYDAAAQSATLLEAEHNGEGWSQTEIDFVLEFTATETDAEIAKALGRTLYAVRAKQHELRNGRTATGVGRLTGQRVVLPHDRGWASLDALFAGD